MSEEIEIETKDLQETIEELHEERREREEAERRASWTRYIALTTALLAVFAAVGALQSGTLVNEAMMKQLRASDKWNEYQSTRQKDHLYTIQANALLDRGAQPPAEEEKPEGESKPAAAHKNKPEKGEHKSEGEGKKPKKPSWKQLSPDERLAAYIGQAQKEHGKEELLGEEAKKLEEESEHLMHQHHGFARSVALIQVAIALSAVAALTRMKSIWIVSMVAGAVGIALFAMGFMAHG